MTAITAVTWQNTVAVEGVTPIPPEAIIGQVKAVVEDIGVDAVKVGMLGTVEVIDAVAQALELVGDAPIVIDPVMVAESGAHLLEPGARAALVGLLPRATVATPNLAEARALVETAGVTGTDDPEDLARAVHELGPRFVVVTGGHGDGVDVFFDGHRIERIAGEIYPDGAAHGSGCTHSSSLAAHLALGHEPLEAARAAKRIASEAVRDGLGEVGAGAGPVDVFGLSRTRS